MVVEIVAEDVDFIRNIDYERGNRVAEELRSRGLFNAVNPSGQNQLTSISLGYGGAIEGIYDTPMDQTVMASQTGEQA